MSVEFLVNPTEEEINELNRQTAIIVDRMYMHCLSLAGEHSIEAANMFDTWWKGGLVYNDEYKNSIPEDCYEHGHSIIAHATSQGFG
ncbi:gp45 [Bacillus phage W.Ph.]|uniref:Gp45 n=1 Tax=Bacillus phage W.Ph. TaxID=764595 RepID=G9B1E6_9CAUD|nr:gp45 [Bacillus phage W.Ph.]ADH03191.1 gp45 [Bacillus phage W.Ph.]